MSEPGDSEENAESIGGRACFCSWSGGKDSCLALHRAIRSGAEPRFLLTMMTEGGERSRSHGLHIDVLRSQAAALGVPLVTRAASWQDYESEFAAAIRGFRREGIDLGVFGDIDIEAHREWVERVCASADIQPHLPLWRNARLDLLEDFLGQGFAATVIAVNKRLSDAGPLASGSAGARQRAGLLGKTLDMEIIARLESMGIDGSGERGEYHTVVTDGPVFSAPLRLDFKGEVARDGYLFLDVSTKGATACL